MTKDRDAWHQGEIRRLKDAYLCARAMWAAEQNQPEPTPLHHEKVKRLFDEMNTALDLLIDRASQAAVVGHVHSLS